MVFAIPVEGNTPHKTASIHWQKETNMSTTKILKAVQTAGKVKSTSARLNKLAATLKALVKSLNPAETEQYEKMVSLITDSTDNE